MRLSLCSRCERFVEPQASQCPFCGTRLGIATAVPRTVLATVMGLALAGCVDKSDDETMSAGGESSGTAAASTSGTPGNTTTQPSTATDGNSSATTMTSDPSAESSGPDD